jgi:hypothetical protein
MVSPHFCDQPQEVIALQCTEAWLACTAEGRQTGRWQAEASAHVLQ